MAKNIEILTVHPIQTFITHFFRHLFLQPAGPTSQKLGAFPRVPLQGGGRSACLAFQEAFTPAWLRRVVYVGYWEPKSSGQIELWHVLFGSHRQPCPTFIERRQRRVLTAVFSKPFSCRKIPPTPQHLWFFWHFNALFFWPFRKAPRGLSAPF